MALGATAVAVAAPGGTAVGDNPATAGDPGLAQVGPVAKNGFPAWYKDKNGTRLEPCLDAGDPLCIMGALPNPDSPVTPDRIDQNFPDEFFYQAASAGIDNVGVADARGRAGRASLDASLEGAFLNGQTAGEQMAFARLRLRVTSGLQGGTNYLFVHPYGERTIATDPDTDSLFVTEDIGVTPGKFDDALHGRIGPFLTWDPKVAPAAPEGYTGDPNVDHAITGGKNDYFAIIGPGVGANKLNDGSQDCGPDVLAMADNAPGGAIAGTTPDDVGDGTHIGERDCIKQSLFSLMGKLADNAGVDVKSATFSRDVAGNTAVDVQAESDGGQTIVVRPTDNRTSAARLFPTTQMAEDHGRYFAHITMDKDKGFPNRTQNQVEVLNATDRNPQDSKLATPIDEILDATATWDNTLTDGNGTLTVAARSSDQFPDDQVTLTVDDPNTGEGMPVADGQATLTLPAAPRTVTITSSAGATLTIPVHSDLTKAATPAPLRANAGRPVKAAAGATVKLFGTGSTGPIASYAWTGPYAVNPDGTVDTDTLLDGAGGNITAGADADTATLTAPGTADRYGYRLEVKDDDGTSATATTVLTVTAGGVTPTGGDPLTPGKVRYTAAQGRMVIDGTATVRTANEIKIWFANHVPADPANTQPDATAIVDPVAGSWAFDTGRDGMPTPPNADCVSYISLYGNPDVVGDNNTLAPADEWNCLPIDGRGVVLPTAPPPPGGAAAAAAAAPRALAGAVPALGGGATVALARVTAPARVTAAALATSGVPVNVTVPAGATLLRLRVLNAANKALLTTFKKVKGGKKAKVTIRSAKLARTLRGSKRFVVEVRAGTARNRLGKATRTVIRIRR